MRRRFIAAFAQQANSPRAAVTCGLLPLVHRGRRPDPHQQYISCFAICRLEIGSLNSLTLKLTYLLELNGSTKQTGLFPWVLGLI